MWKKLVCIFVFVADRLTKWWAFSACAQEKVVTPFLSFHLTCNRGISWSIGHSDKTCPFVLLSLLIGVFILLFMLHTWRQSREGVFIGGEILVLTGAISNTLDRVFYGGVVDFIVLKYGEYTWPLFNIADLAIVCGAIMMMITGIRFARRRKRKWLR